MSKGLDEDEANKPTKPASSRWGSNKSGDTDLVVPVLTNQQHWTVSSFDATVGRRHDLGLRRRTPQAARVNFSAYPAAGSGSGRTGITNGSLADRLLRRSHDRAAQARCPGGVTESNYAQVPYLLGGAVIGYNLGAGFSQR